MEYIKIGDLVFGNWTVSHPIGEGGFGKVYALTRNEFGTDYFAALKVITIPSSEAELQSVLGEGMSHADARRYFYTVVKDVVKEFALMSKLKGVSNIVGYEDHQVAPHPNGIGWNIFIRMELLTPILPYAYARPFTRRDIIRLGIDMCKALELCQKYNIIHRDLKPDNIFVSANGDFKLGDFGIARTIEKTSSGLSKKGTYNYMAPEVYRGEAYGFSVDMYALGIVLYRLLNKNRVPFLPLPPVQITYSQQEAAIAHRMRGNPIPLPFYSQGRLPEIVIKACAFDPAQRYSSPQQMRQELEQILYTTQEAEIIYPYGDGVELEKNPYIPIRLSDDVTIYTTISQRPKPPEPIPEDEDVKPRKKLWIPIVIGGVVALAIAAVLMFQPWKAIDVPTKNDDIETEVEEEQDTSDEDIETYNEYMEEATSMMTTDPAGTLDLLLEAQELQPDNPDPFVQYAYALYLSRDYETCIDYIENDLALGKAYDITDQSLLAEILGSAYFEQQDYAQAASFIRLSTAGGDLTVSAMRDYAVSLGRLGDIDAADEVLQTMFDAGATAIETTYVQAEVDYAKENYLDAEAGFQTVLEEGDDTVLQIRAMRTLAEVYRDCAALERTGQSPISGAAVLEAELLAEGIDAFGLRYDSTLWEMLALAYFEAYHATPGLDESWLYRSADAFNLVIELGIQKEYLYTNLYSIYYELGDYEAAEGALVDYGTAFPNAYTPHALRATMLIAIENQKSQESQTARPDYRDAYAEFLVAESMLGSGDDTTYYVQVKTLIDTLLEQGWL